MFDDECSIQYVVMLISCYVSLKTIISSPSKMDWDTLKCTWIVDLNK